jgi:hypothetical protein
MDIAGFGIHIQEEEGEHKKEVTKREYFLRKGSCVMQSLVNPRRMREGYGSRFVCLCVCVSVTNLAATYLVHPLKIS